MSVIQLQAIDMVLKKWEKNPKLTKREIGVWHHWTTNDPSNDLPLTQEEVSEMKHTLKKASLRLEKRNSL